LTRSVSLSNVLKITNKDEPLKAFFKLATAVMAFVLTTNYSVAQEIPSQENWANSKQFIQMPNGSRLAYVAMGNPQGQATLLIHGYTDNSRSWSLLAPYLKDRQLIAIDLRGHGPVICT